MEKTQGEVIHGQKKGQKLGYPTANVQFKGDLEQGVYWGWAIIDNEKYKAGMMHREGTDILEAHVIGFSGNLYGKTISLELEGKIRDIIKFDDSEDLIGQIKEDIEKIKKL